jgi:hypothetical protein
MCQLLLLLGYVLNGTFYIGTGSFQPTFLKKESEAYEIISLSVCLRVPPNNFSIKFSREVMPLKVTSTPYFLSRTFNHFKMADVQTSEVDAKLAPVNVRP